MSVNIILPVFGCHHCQGDHLGLPFKPVSGRRLGGVLYRAWCPRNLKVPIYREYRELPSLAEVALAS